MVDTKLDQALHKHHSTIVKKSFFGVLTVVR